MANGFDFPLILKSPMFCCKLCIDSRGAGTLTQSKVSLMFHRIAFILTLLLAFTVQAQEYPVRAVTLVVPYPLSGPTDIRGASRMTKTY